MDELDWKRPALIGGLISGILSALPWVSMLNVCFCLWAWIGGLVTAKLLIGQSQRIVTAKDGAKVGLYAGLLAAAIVLVISTPLMLWQMDQTLQNMITIMRNSPEAESFYTRVQNNPSLKVMFSFIVAFISSILVLGFTVLGGLLGVALFEKRRVQPPPQSPSGYPPNYPPSYPPNYPPQYPPPSGGSGGDQGG